MKICGKCSKNIQWEEGVCPYCGELLHTPLFSHEQKRIPFNFTGFCIVSSFLPVAGVLLGIIRQNTLIAVGSILGFWVLIYFCLWLMCAIDCFQAKDGTGFLLLLLLPVIGMVLVITMRER